MYCLLGLYRTYFYNVYFAVDAVYSSDSEFAVSSQRLPAGGRQHILRKLIPVPTPHTCYIHVAASTCLEVRSGFCACMNMVQVGSVDHYVYAVALEPLRTW